MTRRPGYTSSRPATDLTPPPKGPAPGADWRSRNDRDELVERLIAAEKANRLLEDELRRRVRLEERHLLGHPEAAALMAENKELRQIIERLNAKILRRAAS